MTRPARAAVAAIASLLLPLVTPTPVRAASGDITTYAGGPGRGQALTVSQRPNAVAVSGTKVYVADVSVGVIRRIDTVTGYEDVVVGDWLKSGTCGPTGTTSTPNGVALAVDRSGNLYVSITIAEDYQYAVCRIAPNGSATLVAGGGEGEGNEIPATQAEVRRISALAVDAAGNLYIAENRENDLTYVTVMSRVRRVDPSGVIHAFAGKGPVGNGGDGGPAVDARLRVPNGLAVGRQNDIYIADTDNNRIRRVAGGVITTIAGNGLPLALGDGLLATLASLNKPHGVTVDPAGNLLIADTGNHRVRRVTSNGVIKAFAGSGANGSSGDGGPATSAKLRDPVAVAVADDATTWIADVSSNKLRTMYQGTIRTGAGNGDFRHSGDGGPAVDAELDQPMHLTLDSAGRLLIADNRYVRRVNLNGRIVTLAGDQTGQDSGDEGPAASAGLGEAVAVAYAPNGDLYIAESAAIRRIDSSGLIHHVAGNDQCCGSEDNVKAAKTSVTPEGLAIDSTGRLWFSDVGWGLRMIDTAGYIHNIPGTVYAVGGTAIDAQGKVLFASYFRLMRYDPVAHSVTVLAGQSQSGSGGDGGPAVDAELNFVWGIAVGPDGSIYLTDFVPDIVRKIDPAGIINTIAGQSGHSGFSGDGGPATAALLHTPTGIVVDSTGNVFVTDAGNGRIRKIAA